MNTRSKLIMIPILFLFCTVFSGCASKIMQPSTQIVLEDHNKASITFLMSSTLTEFGSSGQSITPIEFDVWDGQKFIGALSKRTYFQYVTDPGKHVFVARGSNWSFLKANLDTGKSYYVFVNLYPSFWGKERVIFQPVKKKDRELIREIPQYLEDLQPISVIDSKLKEYEQHRVGEVENEFKIFQTTEYGHSLLDLEDGI